MAQTAIHPDKKDLYNRNRRLKKLSDPEYASLVRERARKDHAEHRTERLAVRRRRYAASPEKPRARRKEWAQQHPEYGQSYRRVWKRLKRAKFVSYRIDGNMSRAVARSLHGSKLGRRWSDLVGYTEEDLRAHLERQFSSGMTWANYGSAWHVDHIIPRCAFNFREATHIDFGRCWSLSNLRPLWAKDNFKKNRFLDAPFQPSLALG